MSDEHPTPPRGTAVSTSSSIEERQVFDLSLVLASLAQALSRVAAGSSPVALAEANRLLGEAEIQVHDARRALRALTLARNEEE